MVDVSTPGASSSSGSSSPTDELKHQLAAAITGVESPLSGSSAPTTPGQDDDITPFPSPALNSLSLTSEDDAMSDVSIESGIDMDKDVTSEMREESLKIKGEANKAFSAQDYSHAIELFTRALALDPKNPVFWVNRAAAKMKLEEYGGAAADATRAIELDEGNVKAYYRRALSRLAILKPTLAVPDFRTCLKLDPSNAIARKQLDETLKLIRRIEFEKAISVGEIERISKKVLNMLADGSVPLEKDYDGPMPQWDEEAKRYTPTQDFVRGMIDMFKKGGKLPKRLAWEVVLGCKDAVEAEESLVETTIEEGVVCDVVGDTHGQFFDLCNLLSMIGEPSDSHMIVFNGDFVDRGSWSIEVVLTLFAYKWLYPKRVYLNRGNHETSDMNKVYGFEGECKAKHGEMTYKLFAEVFTALPLSTLITASQKPSTSSPLNAAGNPAILSPSGTRRFFIVHGGLFSKDDVTLDDVRKIDRFGKQPGQEGLMCELLWTDPQEMNGRGPSKRGVGVGFGPDVTKRWCEANKVSGVIRSHEVRQDGFAIEHDGLCITVFSCPNYCDSTGNRGAYIRIQADGELAPHQFDAVPHPPMRPMAYSGGFAGMGM